MGCQGGVNWCKSEVVICSELIKLGKSWADKGWGFKWCNSEGVISLEGVK